MPLLSYFFILMHPLIPIVFYVTALSFVTAANMPLFLRDIAGVHSADHDFVDIAEHMGLGIEVETELNIR